MKSGFESLIYTVNYEEDVIPQSFHRMENILLPPIGTIHGALRIPPGYWTRKQGKTLSLRIMHGFDVNTVEFPSIVSGS